MIGAERTPGRGAAPAMMLRQVWAPALGCRIDGPRGIAPAVDAVIGPRGLGGLDGIGQPLTPRTLDLVGLATLEVLHSVLERCGDRAAGASVELWIEPQLAVLVVGYTGPALPDWLLANWDRNSEPALDDTPAGCGWGWLLVREALDGVGFSRCGARRLLLLEKRL